MKTNDNLKVVRFIQKNEFFVHIAFWIIYFSFPFLKAIGKGNYPKLYNELNDLCFGIIVFYISYTLFAYSKRKSYHFVVLLIAFCGIGYLNLKTHNWIFEGTHTEAFWYYSLGYISTYTILALFAYVLYSLKEGYKNRLELDKANLERHQAELASLKSQINPHFLFNTLNTIYSSALKKDDKTPEMILKLSDSFRYVLHEGQKQTVKLEQEINHLNDYISLQQERLRDKVIVEFLTEIDNKKQEIVPLLLISFIENAFKNTSFLKGKDHLIKIRIALKNNMFSFYCENPYVIEKNDQSVKESGIGISNTKKRLLHVYPKRHILNIDRSHNIFKVTLQIHL